MVTPLAPSSGGPVPLLQSTQGQKPSEMGPQPQNTQSRDAPSPLGVKLSDACSWQ
jgi:hypothetical protein